MRAGLAAVVCAVLLGPVPAASAAPPLSASLSCRRESGPGRVLCEVEVESQQGRLLWADALVLEAPEFARVLRTRVGPLEATTKSERRLRLPLAMLADKNGKGALVVRARAVVCTAAGRGESCVPRETTARTEVEVGPVRPAG